MRYRLMIITISKSVVVQIRDLISKRDNSLYQKNKKTKKDLKNYTYIIIGII